MITGTLRLIKLIFQYTASIVFSIWWLVFLLVETLPKATWTPSAWKLLYFNSYQSYALTPYSILDTTIGSIRSFLSMSRASASSSVQRGLDFSLDTDNSSKLRKLQEQQAIIQKQIEQWLVSCILVWAMTRNFVWCIPLFDFQCTKLHHTLIWFHIVEWLLCWNTTLFLCHITYLKF